MEAAGDPKNNSGYQYLKLLMGEDGVAYLDLDEALAAIKEGQSVWQAPFSISLHALPFFFKGNTDGQGARYSLLVKFVLSLFSGASEAHKERKGATLSGLIGSALEPLEALADVDLPTRFHAALALGLLLLGKGDEEAATRLLCPDRHKSTYIEVKGLKSGHVENTKAFAAVMLQDFYARKGDYETALNLLIGAIDSDLGSLPSPLSESLVEPVAQLLDSWAERCESENCLSDWVGLFDCAANVIESCGEADTSGSSPSDCKVASPQFLAWKFGELAGRYAIRNCPHRGESDAIFGGYGWGGDWGHGTAVASLLWEYDEHRDWDVQRERYLAMWESSDCYQRLSICDAGTRTDLYWAMKIGFADRMLNFGKKTGSLQAQTGVPDVRLDIEMTKYIATTIALRQMKEQQFLEEVVKNQQKMFDRLPPTRQEIEQQLQQSLSSVWGELPAKVMDFLFNAERYYKSEAGHDDAKVWFNKAVEASFNCCFVEPLVAYVDRQKDKKVNICFAVQREVKEMSSNQVRKMSLWEWADVVEALSVLVNGTIASVGTVDLRRFIEGSFGTLPQPALMKLSSSLKDFCQYRKDSAHDHIPRHEQEIMELEQMRELALGCGKRASVITQIFQLFDSKKLPRGENGKTEG